MFLLDSDKERLFSNILIGDNCWEWRGYKTYNGYGQITICRKSIYIHRLVYSLLKKDLKLHSIIRHTCDNPLCCNPKHLIQGTHLQNMRDIVVKGRAAKGSNCAKSKLNEFQVYEILNNLNYKNIDRKILAKIFNIDATGIIRIRKRQTWKHVKVLT